MTILRRQVVELVRKEAASAGGVRALARKWRLSAPYISDILRGFRNPGPSVLKKLNLQKVPQAPVEPSYVSQPTAQESKEDQRKPYHR